MESEEERGALLCLKTNTLPNFSSSPPKLWSANGSLWSVTVQCDEGLVVLRAPGDSELNPQHHVNGALI